MTDLEITNACAAAMGYQDCADHAGGPALWFDPESAPSAGYFKYNPLHDDAQAAALAKNLRLSVFAAPLAGWIVQAGQDFEFTRTTGTDWNRAICTAVAQMRRAKAKA